MSVKTSGLGLSSVLVSEEEIQELRDENKKMKTIIKSLHKEVSRLGARMKRVEKQASSNEVLVTKLSILSSLDGAAADSIPQIDEVDIGNRRSMLESVRAA